MLAEAVARVFPAAVLGALVILSVPVLHVPILGLLAFPVALPALLVFAATPLLVLRPEAGWARGLAGAALLGVGGVLAAGLVVHAVGNAGEVWLARREAAFVDRSLLANAAGAFGALVAGAGVARGGGLLHDLAWGAAYLAVAAAAAGALSFLAALGLPMGA